MFAIAGRARFVGLFLVLSACHHDGTSTSTSTTGAGGSATTSSTTATTGSSSSSTASPTSTTSTGGIPSLPMELGAPPIGAPINSTAGQWQWVDFPDSACDDGSATGLAMNVSSTSKNVLVFFNGGGACWDYLTCYQLNTATHGPYQQAQFQQFASASLTGTIFDRSSATNPFKDWSYVFLPYCTGDIHSGNNVMTYTSGSTSNIYHHVGHANVLAYLKRLGATFPSPDKLVVSGASAGGFGALLSYPYFRWYWPQTKAYLLDDSGPLLEQVNLPSSFVSAWVSNWKLGDLLTESCGASCLTDISNIYSVQSKEFPTDRLALLSSLQDKTISGYFLLSATQFQTALLQLSSDRLDPTTNSKYFFVSGNTHTMLGNTPSFSSNGVALDSWLTQFVNDDAAWQSTKP